MRKTPKTPPVLYSDPVWEAMKSSRRSLSHNDAVQESFFLQQQFRTLRTGGVGPSPVDLNEILRTLTGKKIPFVLTGAHAIGSWTGRPRATKDVDLLVKGGRNFARVVKALRAMYPELEVRPFAGVTSFFIPGEKESVIDVTYPHRADIAETLATPVWAGDGFLRYRIPSLEAALANKYGAMLSLTRGPGKRGQDAVDFYYMVLHSTDEGREAIDLVKLGELGEKVWPGGGGEHILRLVEQAKAGQVPTVRPVDPLQE